MLARQARLVVERVDVREPAGQEDDDQLLGLRLVSGSAAGASRPPAVAARPPRQRAEQPGADERPAPTPSRRPPRNCRLGPASCDSPWRARHGHRSDSVAQSTIERTRWPSEGPCARLVHASTSTRPAGLPARAEAVARIAVEIVGAPLELGAASAAGPRPVVTRRARARRRSADAVDHAVGRSPAACSWTNGLFIR